MPSASIDGLDVPLTMSTATFEAFSPPSPTNPQNSRRLSASELGGRYMKTKSGVHHGWMTIISQKPSFIAEALAPAIQWISGSGGERPT